MAEVLKLVLKLNRAPCTILPWTWTARQFLRHGEVADTRSTTLTPSLGHHVADSKATDELLKNRSHGWISTFLVGLQMLQVSMY